MDLSRHLVHGMKKWTPTFSPKVLSDVNQIKLQQYIELHKLSMDQIELHF